MYGAVHLEAATFDQKFPILRFRQFFNPSWENIPFDALNKTPRVIFIGSNLSKIFISGHPKLACMCITGQKLVLLCREYVYEIYTVLN